MLRQDHGADAAPVALVRLTVQEEIKMLLRILLQYSFLSPFFCGLLQGSQRFRDPNHV